MKKDIENEEDYSPYCEKCGGCGYIGCCGIRGFLKHHVEGKTDCPNEASFIMEIVEYIEEHDTFKLNFPEGDDTKLNKSYKTETYEVKDGKRVKISETNIGTEPERQIKLAAFCPDPQCDGNCNYQSHPIK